MASLYKKPVRVMNPITRVKELVRSDKWWGRYKNADGREVRVPLSTDKTAAQAMLAALVRKAERTKAGLFEPEDRHIGATLDEHLADYRAALEARENSPRYCQMAVRRVEIVFKACKIRKLVDIAPTPIALWLKRSRDAKRFGIGTSNDYLIAVKCFCSWMTKEGRLPKNPLAAVQRLNVEPDIRRERRALLPEELARLIAAAGKARIRRRGIGGRDRAMIYRLAALTGLRAQELASLTPESFALDATPPTVTVAAGYSKRRRRDVLPLHADLVERLRPFLAKKKPQVRLWPGLWYRRGAGSVKRDLALARKDWIAEATSDAERKRREKCDFLAYRDRQGRVADFHALRHGFITYLVSGNVPPKVAQMLARHSTITLTMDRYTHLGMDDMARALGKLPGV